MIDRMPRAGTNVASTSPWPDDPVGGLAGPAWPDDAAAEACVAIDPYTGTAHVRVSVVVSRAGVAVLDGSVVA